MGIWERQKATESWSDSGWRDDITPFFTSGKSSAAPSLVADADGWITMQFGVGDEVFLYHHVQHDYKPGSKAYPHIHWQPTTIMALGQTVVWEYSYKIAKGHQQGQSLFGGITTIQIIHTADGTELAGEHIVTEATDEQAFQLVEPDVILHVRVKRISGTYPEPVIGIVSDLHYQIDRYATVNKRPNFYN